jgi:hypothetical protein
MICTDFNLTVYQGFTDVISLFPIGRNQRFFLKNLRYFSFLFFK